MPLTPTDNRRSTNALAAERLVEGQVLRGAGHRAVTVIRSCRVPRALGETCDDRVPIDIEVEKCRDRLRDPRPFDMTSNTATFAPARQCSRWPAEGRCSPPSPLRCRRNDLHCVLPLPRVKLPVLTPKGLQALTATAAGPPPPEIRLAPMTIDARAAREEVAIDIAFAGCHGHSCRGNDWGGRISACRARNRRHGARGRCGVSSSRPGPRRDRHDRQIAAPLRRLRGNEDKPREGMTRHLQGQDGRGKTTYGGYSKSSWCRTYVLRVPTASTWPVPSLLCAGITKYSPPRLERRAGAGRVFGLGGLGHMGVKFAKGRRGSR